MTNTGIVRKIDDLGRIVIPKEIRISLDIDSGDDLAFSVEGENIILKKYNYMNNIKKKSERIIESVENLADGNILLTDREKIVTKGFLENAFLPKSLSSLIKERKNYVSQKAEELKVGETTLKGYFIVKILLKEGNLLGSIILYKKEVLLKEDHLFTEILKNIIENS